jgi:hypothetical protein
MAPLYWDYGGFVCKLQQYLLQTSALIMLGLRSAAPSLRT